MSVLHRKLGRDLFHARGLLAAIVSIIIVGVASFVGMGSAYRNLKYARDDYYARGRMADFWIDLRRAPLSVVQDLEQIPGVERIHPRLMTEVIVDLDDVPEPIGGFAIALPDQPQPVLNDVQLIRGSYFSDQRHDEIILNDAFARARDLRPGDTIHIVLNNRKQQLVVVGTALSCEFVYLIRPGAIVPDPRDFGVFYLKQSFAEDAFDMDGACNQVVGSLAPSVRQHPRRVLDQIEQRLEPYGVFSVTPREQWPSHRFLDDEIQGGRVTTVIVPVVFLSVAALVLNILMTRLIDQQRTIIGTLKASGYSDRQITLHYLMFGVAVGAVGGGLGLAGGYLLAEGMTDLYRQFYEFPRLENRLYPLLLAGGVGISVFFAMLGAVRGVRTAVRLQPAEALRPRPPLTATAVFLEKLRWLWSMLGYRWRLALRNAVRQRTRTLASMTAAATGAALLMLTAVSQDSMNYLVDFQFDKVMRADFELVFREPLGSAALLEARRLPGVAHAEPVFNVAATLANGHRRKRISITGLRPDATLIVPRDAEGNAVPIPRTGLLLTRKLAEILHVEAGDPITMTPVRGDRQPRTLTVVRVTDSYLGLSAYADFHFLNDLMSEDAAITSVQMQIQGNDAQRLELYRQTKQLPTAQAINDLVRQRERLRETLLGMMTTMASVMVLFAGIFFFGSILTSSLIALAERRREVATLYAMGYSPWEIGFIFFREVLVVNLSGILIGIPLGYLIVQAVWTAYDTELYRMPVVVHPRTIIAALVIGLAFTVVAHLLVQRAIHRTNWIEALSARE